jgi:multiple sugar transport system substrate-binding protein
VTAARKNSFWEEKKMKKKFIAVLLSVTLAGALMIGCATDDPDVADVDDEVIDEVIDEVDDEVDDDENDIEEEPPVEGLSPYAGQTVSVGIWAGSDAEIATRPAFFEAFTAETGIYVEERVYTDFETQLRTDLIGGTAPDVFYVDSFLFPELQHEGVLVRMNDFIANTPNFNQDDFYQGVLSAFMTDDGGVYGLPKDFSTLGLFYNIGLLEGAGFTPDDIPDAMADMPAFLAELQAGLPDGVVAAATTADLARHVFVLQANGTSIVDEGLAVLDGDDQLEYLQMLVDAFHDGLVQRPADLGNDWSGDSFGLENVALMIEGNWAIAHVQQNFPDVDFGARELPTMAGQQGTMVFTVCYAINAASDQQGAAWEFVNFATGTEGMAIMAGGASLIPSRATTAEILDLPNNEIMAPFVAGGAYATPWQHGITLSIILREYNNMLPAALSGDMTLREAMEEAMRVANNDIELHILN